MFDIRVSTVVMASLLGLHAQVPDPAQTRARTAEPVLRVEKSLVLIPVSATDLNGRFVNGLHAEDFQLRDNGKLQRLSSVVVEDGPISLCIVFDVSNSMTKAMPYAREAVRQLLVRSSPEDEFILVTFRGEPSVDVQGTSEPGTVLSITEQIEPDGGTALFDALILAMNELRHAKYKRRAVVVISDGADNSSRYTSSEVLSAVREAEVAIYPTHLSDWSSESLVTEHALRQFATDSGGRYSRAKEAADFPQIAESLEVRRYYVLGYSPQEPKWDGKYRKVALKVPTMIRGQSIRLSWRRGYFTPGP